jgi:hypothetical protein
VDASGSVASPIDGWTTVRLAAVAALGSARQCLAAGSRFHRKMSHRPPEITSSSRWDAALPLPPYLRPLVLARRDGLLFGPSTSRPFTARPIQERADAAWLAAGVNAHALCTYMGHSGIQVAIDLYGHLFPGNEAEASALLDAYLTRAFAA